MQVKRVIGGVPATIVLTGAELFAAYEEQQGLFDIEAVKGVFESMPDDNLLEAYGMTYEQLAPLVGEMAGDLRHNLRKEMTWEYALDKAIQDTIGRYRASPG